MWHTLVGIGVSEVLYVPHGPSGDLFLVHRIMLSGVFVL